MEYVIIAAAPAEDDVGVWYFVWGLGWELFPQVLLYNRFILKIDLVVDNNIARLKWQMWNKTAKSWYDTEIAYVAQLKIAQSLQKHNKLHYYHFN